MKRAKVIFEEGSYSEESVGATQGTTHSRTRVGGAVGSSSGTYDGTTTTSTRGVSDLARRMAPPEAASHGGELALRLLLTVVAFFGVGVWARGATGSETLAWLAAGPVAAGLLYWTKMGIGAKNRRSRDLYEEGMARWERTWRCSKCGEVYVEGEAR